MTLQRLFLKLSKNKDIIVESFCGFQGKLTVTISEPYTFKMLIKVDLDLTAKIPEECFKPYIKSVL